MPALWWMHNLVHTHFPGEKTEVFLALTSQSELETDARFPRHFSQRYDKPGRAPLLQLLSQQAALRLELGA